MGDRPTSRHTIERLDGTKGYEPSNCVWATYKVQANNKSNNVIVFVKGVRMTAAQFSDESGIGIFNVRHWLQEGLTGDEILEIYKSQRKSTVAKLSNKNTKWITYKGLTFSESSWSKLAGKYPGFITNRIEKGWTTEAAMDIYFPNCSVQEILDKAGKMELVQRGSNIVRGIR